MVSNMFQTLFKVQIQCNNINKVFRFLADYIPIFKIFFKLLYTKIFQRIISNFKINKII